MSKIKEKYLEECGSSCPYCGWPDIHRMVISTKIVERANSMPTALITVYCKQCDESWTEHYRLESVEL
jgi:hypothetical protein